jgi:hypothetical protein
VQCERRFLRDLLTNERVEVGVWVEVCVGLCLEVSVGIVSEGVWVLRLKETMGT